MRAHGTILRRLAFVAAVVLALLPLQAAAQDKLTFAIGQRGNWDTAVTELASRAGILKREDRLQGALQKLAVLDEQMKALAAPHVHELVRVKETEAMLLAARFILGASLYRTESRLSHFREDHDLRDDTNWLVWVDVAEGGNGPSFSKTPVPTPYCSVTLPRRKPSRLVAAETVAGV